MSTIPRVLTNKTILTGLPAQLKNFVPFESAIVGASRALKIPNVAVKVKHPIVSEISLSVPSKIHAGLNRPNHIAFKQVR